MSARVARPRTLTRAAACREYGLSATGLAALIEQGTVWLAHDPGRVRPRVVRDGLEAWVNQGRPAPPEGGRYVVMPRRFN